MSWKTTAYVKPLRAAPDGTSLSRGEKLLLFILADYHNDEHRAAWPSGAVLARDALMTLRHVRNLISSLRAKGILCTSQRQSPEGDFDTNLYHFHAIDWGDDQQGGSEMISLPPRGGGEAQFTTVVKPGSSPVVKNEAAQPKTTRRCTHGTERAKRAAVEAASGRAQEASEGRPELKAVAK